MKLRTWTDNDLKIAVADSTSLREVILKLNLAVAGGTYTNIKKHIQRLELSTKHFSGQAGRSRFGTHKNLSLNEILVENSHVATHKLRKILIREGIKTNQCEECNLTTWKNKSITIELHHINGIRNDHRLSNLQMLCPNCHSQL